MPATSVRCSVPTSTDNFRSFFEFGTFPPPGDAQLDLHEVVDGYLVAPGGGLGVGAVGCRGRLHGQVPPQAACSLSRPLVLSCQSSVCSSCRSRRFGAFPLSSLIVDRARPQGLAFRDLSWSWTPLHVASVRRNWAAGRDSPTRRSINLCRGRGHERQQQDTGNAQGLRDVKENLKQFAGLCLRPAQSPRALSSR